MPPVVDLNKCTGAGACADVCPVSVIEIKNKKAVIVRPGDCVECRACEAACPNQAITLP